MEPKLKHISTQPHTNHNTLTHRQFFDMSYVESHIFIAPKHMCQLTYAHQKLQISHKSS